MPRSFAEAFDALPVGTHRGHYDGRRYIFTKTPVADGAGWKLIAEELGGGDYISLNLYRLASGDLLKPCEMPEAKVVRFVTGLKPDTA